ncbi:hypothetical protein SAMN02799624_05442 [Paenibacillus sp. UNC496MF]|uniref:hypothetical protein n=1 Tax=Paenibacillus sp. UNC496MF TaxID=1502753 RepID=UPI0008E9ABE7|nr:hypothetical protein [Paenibacillus sp. UNC496MF]SFJ66251.1 hypothetical protein SAMN02799624_05442 [Paenibacillus sp. UNC496MF]
MSAETFVSGYDPTKDPYLDSRLRSEKAATFLSFIDDLDRLWKLAGKPGVIKRESPLDDEAQFPMVAFKILRRLVNQEFKDIKPRLRTTIRHPYVPDEYVQLYGQIFDVWVQFTVLSTSAEEADLIADELDDFIQMYKGQFKKNGVHEMLFYAQESDQVITDYRFPIAVRPIQYTMRFEKITPVFLNQIEQILAQASAVKPQA